MERLTRMLNASIVGLMLLWPMTVHGQQFVFSLSSNATDPVNVGASKTISISLSYVNGSGGVNYLNTEGLRATRILLRRNNASVGNIAISNPVMDGDIFVNNAFNNRLVSNSGTVMTGYTNLVGFTGFFNPANGIFTTGSTPILMGSFTVTGSTPGLVTLRFSLPVFTNVNDFSSDTPGFITSNSGTGRDLQQFFPSNFIDATFNVISVPEPATWAMIFLSIAAGVAGIVWYRKHRLAQANNQLAMAEAGMIE